MGCPLYGCHKPCFWSPFPLAVNVNGITVFRCRENNWELCAACATRPTVCQNRYRLALSYNFLTPNNSAVFGCGSQLRRLRLRCMIARTVGTLIVSPMPCILYSSIDLDKLSHILQPQTQDDNLTRRPGNTNCLSVFTLL